LNDAERLNQDGALRALLGVEKLPDQNSLGEWLRAIGEPGWKALRRLGRQFVQWAVTHTKKARLWVNEWLECFFDDSQIEVSGPWFEGAAINDEGNWALSWQSLWVGAFLVDRVLGATSQRKESMSSESAGRDVSNQLPWLLESNRALWQEHQSYLYADSASRPVTTWKRSRRPLTAGARATTNGLALGSKSRGIARQRLERDGVVALA
jgi:hypothetical protein